MNERATIPLWLLAALMVAALAATMGLMLGATISLVSALVALASDGVMAILVLLAAGGYGWLLMCRGRLARDDISAGETPATLTIATACAAGLALLATLMLILGSLAPGSLRGIVWWPIIGAGCIAAMAQAHRQLGRFHLPSRLPIHSLVWIVFAVAAGMCLAGAVMPPGWLGNVTMDSYDVLEYHLQLPREFYDAGRIATLDHNVYSHYPLGVEMLFLLGMYLRGGAHDGAHLATMMNLLFWAIMAAGAYGGISALTSSRLPAIAAAVLLATAPWAVYLSWLAMEELAEMCYLALGLLWLAQWIRQPTARAAGWTGAMLGAACSVKYLSVGFVAGPILAVMLIASLRSGRRFAHTILCGAVCLVVFSPWLIRNALSTGNPVFPLATNIFGKGHWGDEQAQRWRDGHAAGFYPPVPVPPGYQPPAAEKPRWRNVLDLLIDRGQYAAEPGLNPLAVLLAAAAILAMLLHPRKAEGWDWALAAVMAAQLALWATVARNMPGRFVCVAAVPMALLIANALGRLTNVSDATHRFDLGKTLAIPLILIVTAGNIALAGRHWLLETEWYRRAGIALPAGVPVVNYATATGLPPGSRLMLVGDAAAFYYPANTIYATVFDRQPLESILADGDSPPTVAAALRGEGVTQVLATWSEIARLERTYGWPAELRPQRLEKVFAGWPVVARNRAWTLYAVAP